MHHHRTFILGLITVIAATGWALAAQSPGGDPAKDSGQSITGAYEGWFKNSDGTSTMLVGYFNRNGKEALDIPVGPNNRIEPGGPDQGQPTYFAPRRQWGIFTITVPKDFGDKKLTWTITANGQTTSIPLALNPLWVVEPYKDAALGNTPPVVRFAADGATFTGPPRGFAQTLTANSSDSLPLTVWVSDDGKVPPERGALRGGGAAANVSWSKFRGPGAVTFENVRPAVDKDGKSSTSAKFSAPGEYVLRLQANDASGDGGGGFQCCWTNVHVKVTVNP